MRFYFLIPKVDATQEILNVTTSRRIEQCRVVQKIGLIVNTDYVVLKVDYDEFLPSPLRPFLTYTADELRDELADEAVWLTS